MPCSQALTRIETIAPWIGQVPLLVLSVCRLKAIDARTILSRQHEGATYSNLAPTIDLVRGAMEFLEDEMGGPGPRDLRQVCSSITENGVRGTELETRRLAFSVVSTNYRSVSSPRQERHFMSR
jgi:hypothetical protein